VSLIETIGDATLYLGDCRDILPTLGKVDAVVTDPPFGMGNFVQTTGNVRGGAVHWNDDIPAPELFEMMRNISRHRIIWGANFFNCFEPNGGAIVWDKCQPMPNFSKADIASCTHFKKTEIVRIPWTNFTVSRKGKTNHPCERPIELYRWCIEYLPQPIRIVLDPFLGSGSCGVAALQIDRKFIGIEREPSYFDIACRRIEEAYRQPRLFDEPKLKPQQTDMFARRALGGEP
jgi:site-specific DNA-methyltransferase (adenine-specific)/modification methylase